MIGAITSAAPDQRRRHADQGDRGGLDAGGRPVRAQRAGRKPITRQIKVQIDYQEIDDETPPNPIGGWYSLTDRTPTKRTRGAAALGTDREDVDPGRYQARMRRNKEELAGADVSTRCRVALRGRLVAPKVYPHTTMMRSSSSSTTSLSPRPRSAAST